MEAARLINPVWWIARQWVRFLTGLAILTVATASSHPASIRTEPVRAASIQTVSTDLVPAHADFFRTVHSGAAFSLPSVTIIEPAPASLASAPAAASLLVSALEWGSGQRPARLVGPRSADVSTAGMRAPPAVGCLLT